MSVTFELTDEELSLLWLALGMATGVALKENHTETAEGVRKLYARMQETQTYEH